MKKQVAVSGRYNSTIAKMFALEDEMEMKALRESGILDSVEESLKPMAAKVGCVVYIGTGGSGPELLKAENLFKNR